MCFTKTGSFPPLWAAVREATGIGFGDTDGGVAVVVVVVVPAKPSVFSSVTRGVSKTVPRLAETMASTKSIPTRPIETLIVMANAEEVTVVVVGCCLRFVVDDNGKISSCVVVAVCLGIFIMLLHTKLKITPTPELEQTCM